MDDPRFSTPRDLARALEQELLRRAVGVESDALVSLFETLFYASLRTEEGEEIRCQVVYVDPANPDPNRPQRITADRWEISKFDTPQELSVSGLVKLARATDPRASSFAVYRTSAGSLEIWGLIDQAGNYHDFINFDAESGAHPPGLFFASIEGRAQLAARIGFETVGELRIGRLVKETTDPFDSGPVREALQPGIGSFVSRARDAAGEEVFERRWHWPESLAGSWVQTICRLLLRARRYGHGGALLISGDADSRGLRIKHGLSYDRVRRALDSEARTSILATDASDAIHEILEEDGDDIPVGLHLAENVETAERADSRRALDGAVWFVSLLTRVDGLVLMTPELEVTGFGVEITETDPPAEIALALDADARTKTPIEYTRWGTRHRSMMRYCWAHPGSVGFVVSQDGDVRVMTRGEDAVIVWENPLLQLQIPHSGPDPVMDSDEEHG